MFPTGAARPARRMALWGLMLLALWQLAGAGWIHAKALVAQQLLARAWLESAGSGGQHKPWPWADTWPVARLRVPALGRDQVVLAGTSGQALAFGPGMHEAFAADSGNWTVLAGHRDTHFSYLGRLEPGMALFLELPAGRSREYRVQAARVVDSRREWLQPPQVDSPHLLLVTCYPFTGTVTSGPLRYVVTARAVQPLSSVPSWSAGSG